MSDSGNFEKMDLFYLGRELDTGGTTIKQLPMLYKNKNLTTHAAIIGMTGSGKTGLGICMLEEAALDGIPAIIIDPKGDMANLLLTFPDLDPADFLPWIDASKAGQKGVTPKELARQTAETWRKGIESWGQNRDRIARLRENADLSVYTPGSTAGRAISVLGGLEVPDSSVLEDNDTFSSLINSSVSSILGLIGIDADPLKSREHILLSSILLHHWRKQNSLSLETLIGNVVKPPLERIGVFPLESFYPMAERMELAMQLNNIIASPAFKGWLEGEPLTVEDILYTELGKPRLTIFSVAHLSEPERMFFVTMLLGRLISWMRRQEGSSGLRCLLYMDEIFGYFPPTANPPSKKPMLLLLKQARAYGLGVILATQNPVDLDYKGLANVGTWFIGRLQTRQDQDKVLSGIADGAEKDNNTRIRQLLANLKSRQFLMRSVHVDETVLFETRWCLSYLKGPISLNEIGRLTSMPEIEDEKKEQVSAGLPEMGKKGEVTEHPPILPDTVRQCYILPPVPVDSPTYIPWFAGSASVRLYNKARGIDEVRPVSLRLAAGNGEIQWARAVENPYGDNESSTVPPRNAKYFMPSGTLRAAGQMKEYEKKLGDFLYRNETMHLYRVPALKLESQPGETKNQFQMRLADVLREQREEDGKKVEEDFRKKRDTLERQLDRALDKVEKEKSDVTARGMDTALSFGVAIFGAIFGRRGYSVTNASRSAQGVRNAGRLMREKQDVQRAEDDVRQIQSDIDALALEFQNVMAESAARFSPDNFPVEDFFITPRRADIFNVQVYLQWEPVVEFDRVK